MSGKLEKNFLMWEDTPSAARSSLAAEALRRGGRLRLQVRGESMLPSLWPGDTVEIADCPLEDVHSGEIVLALREGRFFLHRFLERRGQDGFLLRGDAMPAPDPFFASTSFHGRLIRVVRAGRTIPLPGRLRPWSRALGVLLCFCGIARSLVLKVHSRRTSQAPSLPGSLAKDPQGTR